MSSLSFLVSKEKGNRNVKNTTQKQSAHHIATSMLENFAVHIVYILSKVVFIVLFQCLTQQGRP